MACDVNPTTPLGRATWAAGATLRRLAPEATSALVDICGEFIRIISVFAGDTEIDTADDVGPFDCETLGEADEILRAALDEEGPGAPGAAGWQLVPDEKTDQLYRITFPAHPGPLLQPTRSERGHRMTTHAPQAPAYPLPGGQKIGAAAHEALQDLFTAQERVGRVMALVTAAAVRDILTENHHDAPFDAEYAELVEAADGSLHATGRYWTADGTETSFTATLGRCAGDEVFGMNEWVPYLDGGNERVWKPLVEEMPAKDGQPVYRIDLARAAALPLE